MKYFLILIFILLDLNAYSQELSTKPNRLIKGSTKKTTFYDGGLFKAQEIPRLTSFKSPGYLEREVPVIENNHFKDYPPRDSVLTALKNLRVELNQTQMHLNKAHKNLKWGLLTSVIGYSIVVTGGVLGGTDNYANWGQPLIFTGGIIGIGGGVFVINGVNHLGKAGTP